VKARFGVGLACFLALSASFAHAQDALDWLQRMNQAAKTLNYTGVFVYQSRGRSETSKVTHLADASGEHERLETLDGAPREVVRNNEEVLCYLPAERLVVVDKAGVGRFPERLVARPSTLGENYMVRLGEVGRVAGREAQLILLLPRDEMRYGYQLWADTSTGLLLKARMVGDSSDVIEQFAYTELSLGGPADREKLRPRTVRAPDWQVVNVRGIDLRPEDVPWSFRGLPTGFRLQSIVKRVMHGGSAEALHAVFSDGLANVSVFIEQTGKGSTVPASASTASTGSTGIFKRMSGDHLVTALGEVPAQTLQRIAEGVEARKK
jgi:sigma-E factor negative regulatory protein RseB